MPDILPFPDKRYTVIYADPPWAYRQAGATQKARGTAVKHYPTMTTAEICAMPVREICGGGSARMAGTFGEWVLIPAPTRRCACWECPKTSRPGSRSAAIAYTRSLRPLLRAIARNRTKPGGGSWNCWATFPELNYLPASGRTAGTPGATRPRRNRRKP